MIFKSDDDRPSELNGFLDSGSRLAGELSFDASFRIDGAFTGKVLSEGSLVVGEGGEVDGEMRVGTLFVSGLVKGTVHAARRIQLASGARVFADLETPSLVVEDGALFGGRCTMTRDGERIGESASPGEPQRGPRAAPSPGAGEEPGTGPGDPGDQGEEGSRGPVRTVS